jgi:hypothetical protein
MVSRRAARGRRAGGWGDAAARGEKRGFGILILAQMEAITCEVTDVHV